MLTEVDHRTLTSSTRSFEQLLRSVDHAWKHGDVDITRLPIEDGATQTRTFQLTERMHSLEIHHALLGKRLTGLSPWWFLHLLQVRGELPQHPFLIGIDCLFQDRWQQPRILFTEPFFHEHIKGRFGLHLRRFDFTWPAGTLVPAMPLSLEVT